MEVEEPLMISEMVMGSYSVSTGAGGGCGEEEVDRFGLVVPLPLPLPLLRFVTRCGKGSFRK